MKTNTLTTLLAGAVLAAFTGAAQAAPKKIKAPKVPKHHVAFAKADTNNDGLLNVFEFAKTQGSGTPLVEVRRRFLPIDVSGAFEVVLDPVTEEPVLDEETGEPILAPIPDGFVSLAEWDAYVATKKKKKSKLSRFELADFDGDGQLDPEEFSHLVSPKVKFANTLRRFDKLDLDDDGFLSEDEFYGRVASEA
jgi:hypothetical protein